jgi:hypothetical protein
MGRDTCRRYVLVECKSRIVQVFLHSLFDCSACVTDVEFSRFITRNTVNCYLFPANSIVFAFTDRFALCSSTVAVSRFEIEGNYIAVDLGSEIAL